MTLYYSHASRVNDFIVSDDRSLVDQFRRKITYLRVSLTEHCNFRCKYCSPEKGTPYFDRETHLQPDEYARLILLFAEMGIKHLRMTGGEPLIYPQVLTLIEAARQSGIAEISLSTNGLLLEKMAANLRDAGATRLNISLDSLDPQRFARITRGGRLERVKRGIETAVAVGFPRISLNVVMLREENMDECSALADYAVALGVDIRFIETMPLGDAGSHAVQAQYCAADAVLQSLSRHFGHLDPVPSPRHHGPARLYAIPGKVSKIGFITPVSDSFCSACNRIRLTAEGRLLYCLGQEAGLDLRRSLRRGDADASLCESIRVGIWNDKPERHYFNDQPTRSGRVFMMRVGG